MMKKWLVMGVLLVAALASACSSGSGGGVGQLAVLHHGMDKDASGNVTVEVTVKNVGQAMAELARVTVNFYDAEKNLVDSSSDSVMNLGPGESWDFTIACKGEASRVTSYDIQTTAGTRTGGL